MANLTITVDAETLKRARIRAIERGESVNSYLADQLRQYADADTEIARQNAVAERLVRLSEKYAGDSGDRTWTREELYDERLERQ